jgi:hypothetical protein
MKRAAHDFENPASVVASARRAWSFVEMRHAITSALRLDARHDKRRSRLPTCLIAMSVSLLAPGAALRADGGTVRLRARAGEYQIAVFTSPTPARVGPIDVSVLAQDGLTGEVVPEARVTVRLTARESGQQIQAFATTAAATNKLYQAAIVQLPEAGWWTTDITIDGPVGAAHVRFDLEIAPPLPRWYVLWPWFSWPILAVAVFACHQMLVRRMRDVRGR